MEEEQEAVRALQAHQQLHQFRILDRRPLVDDNGVHAGQLAGQPALQSARRLRIVEADVRKGELAPEIDQGTQALFPHQVGYRPPRRLFEAAHLVAE